MITPEQETRIRDLFQESYQAIYGGGKFKVLMEQVKTDGDPIRAITMLVSSIVGSTIQDAGETDVIVLYALATILAADLLEGVENAGVQTQPGQMEAISAGIIETVLADNPEFAKAIMENPEVRQMLEQGGPQTPQQGQMPQGVLTGEEV